MDDRNRLKHFSNPMIHLEAKGRESTTEQSLGKNVAELVVWACLGTHEISN